MKYITLIIGLLVMGCGKQEQADTNESTPTTNTNKVDGTTEKPVKELTKEDVVGTYEAKKKNGGTEGVVFLEKGIAEGYQNGKKNEEEFKWKITKEGELYIINEDGETYFFRINKDRSLTVIAYLLKDGKREVLPKEQQITYKRIK